MKDTVKRDLTSLKEVIAQLEEILNDSSIEPDELTIEAEDYIDSIEQLTAAIKEGIE